MSKPALEWTPDCQGKWDYDGPLVHVSTRYWPRGGGFSLYKDGEFVTNYDQGIKPSATSTVYLGEDMVLAEQDFEGETEAEVKLAVELWVSLQYAIIENAILSDKEKT